MFFLLLPLALILGLVLYMAFAPRIGSDPKGARKVRILASAHQVGGRFQNPVPTDMKIPVGTLLRIMGDFIVGAGEREPKDIIPNQPFDKQAFEAAAKQGFALAWFGHSSLLLAMDGVTFLIDPVFGERASTFPFAGPKRFRYVEHMRVDLLPKVDVVLLSHDHYDHLCHETIVAIRLSGSRPRYIAPLGVGAHLERWGVAATDIVECDRWEATNVEGVKLTLLPTRHFSGRNVHNRFTTLWGAWAMEGKERRILFGADSGYAGHFKEIGERFGGFNLALLECGAYNDAWWNIHMKPEETAQAAVDVKARVLMPIHWGKFNLAMHPWKEPITRVGKKAEELGLPLLTPRPGRILTSPDAAAGERWWEGLS